MPNNNGSGYRKAKNRDQHKSFLHLCTGHLLHSLQLLQTIPLWRKSSGKICPLKCCCLCKVRLLKCYCCPLLNIVLLQHLKFRLCFFCFFQLFSMKTILLVIMNFKNHICDYSMYCRFLQIDFRFLYFFAENHSCIIPKIVKRSVFVLGEKWLEMKKTRLKYTKY